MAQRPSGRVIAAEPEKAELLTSAHRGLREAALIFALAAGGWFLLALVSYDAADPGWSHSATADELRNLAGVTGAFAADLLFSLFGWLAGLLPLTFLALAVLQFRSPRLILAVPRAVFGLRALGFSSLSSPGASWARFLLTREHCCRVAAGASSGAFCYFRWGAPWGLRAFPYSGRRYFCSGSRCSRASPGSCWWPVLQRR